MQLEMIIRVKFHYETLDNKLIKSEKYIDFEVLYLHIYYILTLQTFIFHN